MEKNSISRSAYIVFNALVLCFALASLASAAWTTPTGTPPANNAPAPINVGPIAQGKMGNLGIWTLTPTVPLNVRGANGDPTALGSAVTAGTFVFSGLTGTIGSVFGTNSNYDTYIQARNLGASSTVYDILLNPLGGNVGIGTMAPSSIFHLKTADWTKLKLETTGITAMVRQGADSNGMNFTTNAYWDGSWHNDDDTKSAFAYIQHLGNNRMEFRVAPAAADISWTVAMVIQSNGNVGIGDTTPASPLSVGNGDLFQVNSSGDLIKIKNITYSWPSSQGAATTYLKNDGSGGLTWATVAGGVTSVSNTDGTLTISPTTGAVIASLNLTHANTWTGAQTFSANTNFPGSGIWNTSGNVGIGDLTPGAKLEIATYGIGAKLYLTNTYSAGKTWELQSGIPSVSDAYFGIKNVTDSVQTLTITNIGNVGVGITGPTHKLEIVGGKTKTTDGLIIQTYSGTPGTLETGQMWLDTSVNP